MIIITEAEVAAWVDYPSLIGEMANVFIASSRGEIDNYPFVRAELRDRKALFGVKSGCNYTTGDLGLKCGGYWSANSSRGLDRHQGVVLMIDIESGRPRALVAANNLTAFRTAAAAAAAANCLARQDAHRVALLGTGRQALFQLEALRAVRPIESVAAWSPNPERVSAFGRDVRRVGLAFTSARTPSEAVRDADIIVTVTPSTSPLVALSDVSRGAHINAMGADTRGKRELADDLIGAARIWADDVLQAADIGECQHLSDLVGVAAIGAALDGGQARRGDEITIFDGTGMAIQDLAAANLMIAEAKRRGNVNTVSLERPLS